MDSCKIVRSLKQKEFSSILDDIQILISCDKTIDCSEICCILKALYQAVVPSSVELEKESAKSVVFDMIPCFKLCIDYAQRRFSCSELVKNEFFPILYHIIRTYLKAELYCFALSCTQTLKSFLEDPKNDFDKITYIKNISIIFWNDALHFEASGGIPDFDKALELRTVSIEFLFLHENFIDNAKEKINIALLRYYQSNTNIDIEKLGGFLQTMWSYLVGCNNTYEHKVNIYRTLQTWFDVAMKFFNETENIIFKSFLIWLEDISKSCKKKEHKILASCCNISKNSIKFFLFQDSNIKFKKNFPSNEDFCKYFKELDVDAKISNDIDAKIFASTCAIIYSSFAKYFRSLKNLENEAQLTFLQSNISCCSILICHFIRLFSKASVEQLLTLPVYICFSTCHTFINVLTILLKKEENDTKRKQLIKDAEYFVKFSFSNIAIAAEADNMGKNIIAYASCIARIAMTLYGLGEKWYPESVLFFEIADSVFTKCSSFPEYETEETQVALWKLHELFVYVCFLTKDHGRALECIVKSLTIHEKKTKECFTLWRKVKRDAYQNGNITVLSKTVSNILLNMDLKISIEREVMYLVEEFKVYKSERYNLDKEIITLSQEILNMPCLDSVRAYILLQILTMPTNLSEKIADILKKSLSEICMETIILYKNVIAQSPEDYKAKLYLSIAYFWLYHNNVKKIYEIAKEEAQKILKPPTPKPVTAVQNDVEEENDTCDIQPTHPLVSVSFEAETFKNLNLAIQLWHDIPENQWENLSKITKEENILDLIQAAAETFCTAVQECKEMELWLLLHSVSIAVKNKYHEFTSGISIVNLLVKLGYLNLASCFLTVIENEKSLKNSEFENIEIKFKLSKSYYFLQMEKFDEGLQILWDILASPVLEKSFKSVKILHAETLILLCDFLQLPTKAFSYSENAQNLVMYSSLAVLMKSVSLCKVLHKYITEKESSTIGYGTNYEWICFKPLLVKNLLKAHILLGELYFKTGEPRLSRCFLQEALKLAESHVLTYWSSKILLDLAHIDFMCDNFKDCSVKVSGLKYIMDPSAKASCFEVLNQLQTKYSTSNSDVPLSPDSPDGLVINPVPDIALTRQIKQAYIDKIDVMASPMPKKLTKDNSVKKFPCNFNEENFSMNLLQLESSLLSYLLSKTEFGSRPSIEVLQSLLSYFNELRNFKFMNNILSSLKLNLNTEEHFLRFLTKLEVSFYVSVQLEKLEYFSIKNDIFNAKEIIKEAFDFLKESRHPDFSYPDIYALLKYHDIRVTLCACEFYKISLNSSVAYYFCQSVLHNVKQKKKSSENNILTNTPNTPVSRNMPNIVISQYKSKAKKCLAPLKKSLLNSNMKQDLNIDMSGQNSPYVVFSSSDETENFESPLNSLSRASKTRSGPKASKNSDKTDKNSSIHYQIFTQKNTLKVKDASDVWSLCVTDTPKLGKENRKLRSSKKPSKSSQISKKKNNSAASRSKSSKPETRSKKTIPCMVEDSDISKFNKLLNETNLMSNDSSKREMSIEYSRSSPHDKIDEKESFPKSSDQACNPSHCTDILSSDNVFYTPSKITPKTKISHLIDDLCQDLSSLSLVKSKVQQIAAGNLDEIIAELNELRLLIQNSMPYPLYGDICKLLGILCLVKRDGSWNEERELESSFLLSETFSLSLRNVYIGNMMFYKESEFLKHKEIITKTLKTFDCRIEDQMKSFLEVIPENWNVIQVSALHNQEYLSASDSLPCPTKLIISHFRKNSAPIIICTDCSSDERFSSSFLTEFSKILEESYLTMLNNDSKSWWTTRSCLDIRMKDLTRDMENIWLGCWKGLFLGIPQNEERINQLQSAVGAISAASPCAKEKLLKILIDSAQHLSKEQICAAVCHLWNCNHNDDVHKKLCKPIRQISIALPDSDRHPVILILDQSIQDLPWECMPILKGVPVSRMPSLSLLCTKLHMLESESLLGGGFDPSNTYYVLNPGGDLTHSQQYFQERFEKQVSWNGIVGVAPSVKDYISGLRDHEFFIYCGHGSGRKYFEGTSVDKLKLQSTSILMGCSSGKLRRLGRILEAHGIVLRLLLSGCPSITANLWDVTDKDIDRFTDKLLQSLVPNYDDLQCKTYDVAKAVSLSRSVCKMRYLVGAAPVVYGFPVFAKNQ